MNKQWILSLLLVICLTGLSEASWYPNEPAGAPPLPDPNNVQVGDTWDLKYNWSDAANPNGQWEYGDGTYGSWQGVLSTQSDWLPGDLHDPNAQPAWAPGQNSVPGWAKSVNDNPSGYDILTGDVFTHPFSIARWVAPADLTVRVTGNAWMLRDFNGRTNEVWIFEWGTWTDGTNEHHIADMTGVSNPRSNPITYDMTLDVVAGQPVGLFFGAKAGAGDGFPDFAGANMTIEVLPEPATLVVLMSGAIGILLRRKR